MMDGEDSAKFDVKSKRRGWHTAFYYFAEHIRVLSQGKINHKVLYSYVGVNGHYINHENPAIRRRTAALLSRLIHSPRYVDDFFRSYAKNKQMFNEAAQALCEALFVLIDCSEEELISYFGQALWRDVEKGFINEKEDGRADLNIARISNEMHALFAWASTPSGRSTSERFSMLAESYFHLFAFGYLREDFVRFLVDETPVVNPCENICLAPSSHNSFSELACLIKYPSSEEGTVADWWVVDAAKPFSIGRYTDCDLIEQNHFISRLHCRILYRNGLWLLEDMDSLHGSRVIRGEPLRDIPFQEAVVEGVSRCVLERGDRIVLAETSHYWFGAIKDRRMSASRILMQRASG